MPQCIEQNFDSLKTCSLFPRFFQVPHKDRIHHALLLFIYLSIHNLKVSRFLFYLAQDAPDFDLKLQTNHHFRFQQICHTMRVDKVPQKKKKKKKGYQNENNRVCYVGSVCTPCQSHAASCGNCLLACQPLQVVFPFSLFFLPRVFYFTNFAEPSFPLPCLPVIPYKVSFN